MQDGIGGGEQCCTHSVFAVSMKTISPTPTQHKSTTSLLLLFTIQCNVNVDDRKLQALSRSEKYPQIYYRVIICTAALSTSRT